MKKILTTVLIAGCAAGIAAGVGSRFGAPDSPQRLGERNPLKPPFVEIFDDYPSGSEHDQFERFFQVINADGDLNVSGTDRSWGYYNFNGVSGDRQYSKCAYLLYPINVRKCDDWLIPRAIKVEAGKYYHVTMDVSLFGDYGVHTLEVKMGEYNDAEGLNIPVIGATDVTSIIPEQIEGWFVPEYDGLYYMGIHGISDASLVEGNYLFVDNIAMEAARSGLEPDKVTDLSFVSDPDGSPSATISFVAPTQTISGTALSGQLTVNVSRGDDVIRTFAATPGQALEFVDQVPAADTYTYTFEVVNADGNGVKMKVNHFIGMSKPMQPVITSFTEVETGKVRLTWDAPTTDVNGTILNPEKVCYNVYNVSNVGIEMIAGEIDETELTIDLYLEPGQQEIVMLMLSAVMNELESDRVTSDFVFAGYPDTLPYHHPFTGEETNPTIGADGDEGVTWQMLDDFSDPKAQDGDGGYVCMTGTMPGHKGELTTGKIDLGQGGTPYVSFYTYVYPEDENEIAVKLFDVATGETTTVGTFNLKDYPTVGWTRIICPLTGFEGRTVRVILGITVETHGYTPIDNLRIEYLKPIDLAVESVDFTPFATIDEAYVVNARIVNMGAEDVDGFTVRLLDADGDVDTFVCGPLASFETTDVELSGRFTAVSPEMPVFMVEVEIAGDGDLSNNESEPFNITFLAPSHPVVSDLKGTEADGMVKLEWTAPDLTKAAPAESLEDFESYAPFTTELNGFTMKSLDEGYVAGFNGLDMPVTKTQQAYWTMTDDDPFNFLWIDGHSSLFTMAKVNDSGRPVRNDDWLISPELYGGRQTISFMACSQTINYGYETFEVYASSKSNDISDFELVMVETQVGEDWSRFFVTLPEGTKYFAIRCTSNDCMMFTLDNISFISQGEPRELEILGYNIYRNGEKLNSEPMRGTTFTAARDRDFDSYYVTTVYDKGESTASNVVRIGVNSIFDIEADSNVPAEYYDLRGIRVNPDHAAPGIYIVRRGTQVSKVLVR